MTALESIYEILSETPEEAAQRESGEFDRIAGVRSRNVVLWGAGNLGRLLASSMRSAARPPLAFCDNDPQMHGLTIDGVPVTSVEKAAADWGKKAVFVVAIWKGDAAENISERIEKLRSIGCESVCSFVPLAWSLHPHFLPFYACDLPSRLLQRAAILRDLANALCDDESRAILSSQLFWRIRGDFSKVSPRSPDQYFPRDLIAPIPDEIFVDAGAYTGDTFAAWRRFSPMLPARYVAIEPDKLNESKLISAIDELPESLRSRIEVHNVVLGAKNAPVAFVSTGSPTSSVGSFGERSQMRSLDTLDSAKGLTFLKIDVEGMELELVRGALMAVREYQPTIAIAVYHKPTDIAELWMLLHEHLPRHCWFLREHEIDGWELVLYGIKPERCIKTIAHSRTQLTRRKCPICKSDGDRRVLFPQRLALFEDAKSDGYDVVVCKSCGAAFADGIPSQENLDCHYVEQKKYNYAHSDGLETPSDFKRFETIIEQLMPFLHSKTQSILDVGCATGGLLSILKSRGFTNLLGIDPSPACAHLAKRLHGIEVRTATVAQLDTIPGSFDLVLLVGVLEHIREVGDALKTLSKKLSSGGLLYCAQPDLIAFAECRNAPYQQFSAEHVNFFSAHSLNKVMASSGFSLCQNWHWMTDWRPGITDSVVSAVYRADPSEAADASSECARAYRLVAYDHNAEQALRNYLDSCKNRTEILNSTLDSLARTQEPIYVWGTGTLTRRLLETSRLSKANIIAFVDSNPGAQGHILAKRETMGPEALANTKEPILICSIVFKDEISRMIRDDLRLSNRIILLS